MVGAATKFVRGVDSKTSKTKCEMVKRIAESLLDKELDWVSFYREVFGLNGVIRQAFSTRESLADFERTETYREIQQMLAQLRKSNLPANDSEEPTSVVTVRLPKSLHEALRAEAHEHHTSMNKLCISKLLYYIDNEMVPKD